MNQFLPFYNDECSMQHKELFDRLLSQARAQEVAQGKPCCAGRVYL